MTSAPRSASQPCATCQQTPNPPRRSVTVRVSLFFDGTLNNRANTRSYARMTEAQQTAKAGTSYANDFSNVAKLEWLLMLPHEGFDHSFKVYTEGIGTVNGGGDDTEGKALGTGLTGVPGKVRAGIMECVRLIRSEITSDITIREIVLDACGFSRGAAAARHFVHKALTAGEVAMRLRASGHTVGSVKVRFVGLFDTVASYGVAHFNDTSDLDLDAVRLAEKVVHLAAGEEHRANFRLTNIASARGNGVEHYLPGVHSDIGGSYVDGAGEEALQLFDLDTPFVGPVERRALDREVTWALDRGWYRLDEFDANRGKAPTELRRTRLENFWNEIRVSRRRISNRYARIPMHLMADYAKEKQLTWSILLDRSHAVPADLAPEEANIKAAIHGSPKPNQDTWMNSMAPWHKALRHSHLHMSSYYGETAGANDPQFVEPSDSLYGRRRRIVQPG